MLWEQRPFTATLSQTARAARRPLSASKRAQGQVGAFSRQWQLSRPAGVARQPSCAPNMWPARRWGAPGSLTACSMRPSALPTGGARSGRSTCFPTFGLAQTATGCPGSLQAHSSERKPTRSPSRTTRNTASPGKCARRPVPVHVKAPVCHCKAL